MKSQLDYSFLSQKEKDFPAMVVMEITNICNLECIHCPYTFVSKQEDYKGRHMSWELYEKITEEVSRYKGVLFRFISDGEPMMHPCFFEMIRLAKAKGIFPINFITNGTLLDEDSAQKVLEAGTDIVEISLDAFTKQTYEKIRRKSNFDLVTSNVHRFIEMRNRKQYQTKIFVSIIDQKEVDGELEQFVDYWSVRVDKVLTRTYTTIGGLVDEKKLKINCDGDRWPCPQLWRRIFINVDGFAEFCVEDWGDQTIVGDANKNSIKEIWASSEYQKIRQAHLLRKFNDVAYCSRCKDWKARTWSYDYFHAVQDVLNDKIK
ncbi:MAG: radical SAM protein [Candidatus Omnitrophica bacterium]|nr:radical SAM protein [Candidatus Omnitrophota bacterium]